jgi:hypothetical protein
MMNSEKGLNGVNGLGGKIDSISISKKSISLKKDDDARTEQANKTRLVKVKKNYPTEISVGLGKL